MSAPSPQEQIEIFAFVPQTLGLNEISAYAKRAEALGFDGIYVPDAIHDGLLCACMALAATTRLKVSISVLVAFPRSPMNVAIACWDLQEMSGGRLELGLGTQIKQNVQDRYSARWLPPAAGMREYVGSLRAIYRAFQTGEKLDYHGEHYTFTRLQKFFNPGPIAFPPPPITLGAVGPMMLALVGEAADGMHTHPTNTVPRYLSEVVIPNISKGLDKRDPALAPPRISAMMNVATGPDAATVASERRRLLEMLAFVFSTPAYWVSLELLGYKELGEEMLQMTRDNRWDQMADAVPDEVADQFIVSGHYEEMPTLLAERFAGLVNRITMTIPADLAHDGLAATAVRDVRAQWPKRFPFMDAT
jgi:probable F420-dependent oxidoreductase